MTGAGHTVGPWVSTGFDYEPEAGWFIREAGNGPQLAVARVSSSFWKIDEIEANARLIAAAPDYQAVAPDAADLLEQYADFIRRDVKADELERHPYLPEIERVVADLRAAIARATGAAS